MSKHVDTAPVVLGVHDISGSDSEPEVYHKSERSKTGSPILSDRRVVKNTIDSDSDKTISEDEMEELKTQKALNMNLKVNSRSKPAAAAVVGGRVTSAPSSSATKAKSSDNGKPAKDDEPQELPMCTYGARCYRKNPDHLNKFRHPPPKRVLDVQVPIQKKVEPSSCGASDVKRLKTELRNGGHQTGFYFTTVTGIPDNFNNGVALSMRDILDPKNGNLQSSAQFNYMFEFPWFMEQYPAEFRKKPLLLVHGEQRMANAALTKRASMFPNVTLCQAPLEIMYGTHHTKMMFLLYDSGLRIVIHTANLVQQDWHQKTQGIWFGPVFPKLEGPPSVLNGDSPTRFKRDLLDYLSAYKVNGLNEWCNQIKAHDMSSARVYIIGSVPGRHTGERKTMFGHLKLRKVLRDSGPEASQVDKTWPLVGQFSSIGSLGTGSSQWLANEWQSSLCATKGCAMPVRSQQLKLIFPSVDNVRVSLEGYPAGVSLPYGKQVAQKQPWLRNFLHQWKSKSFARNAASPHIKTYLRASPDYSKIAWMLLTSANLSKAAWGAHEKNETQLAIRSYELGVLLLSQSFGQTHFDVASMGNHLLVPFDLPPVPYGPKDEPWVWDAPHTALPDRNGNMWQPS